MIVLGKPASNLSSAKFASRTVLETGALGEKKTARALEKWGAPKSVVIAHSLSLPGRGNGDTDHIVGNGNNVILVDSKNWKSGYSYSITPKFEVRRAYGMSTPKGRAFKAGKVHTVAQIDKWKKLLGEDYRVAGIVVITSSARVVYDDNNWKKSPFKIVTIDTLPRILDIMLGPDLPVDPRLVEVLSSRLI